MTTNNLKGDLFGGITAGIVALPLALAFGIQAFGGIEMEGIGAIGALAGLVGATMLGFFAALFSGTHSQISGPTGPMTVITASLVSGLWTSMGAEANIETVLISMSMAGILCGLFQIFFGLIKIGKYIRYIPYPVLSGFMSGIGIIIILQQVYPLFGMKSPVLIVDMITQFPEKIAAGFNFMAFIIGLATILIIVGFPYLTKKVPSTLVALIVMTVVSVLIQFPENLTIGDIPAGMPLPFFAKGFDLSQIHWLQVIQASVIPGLTLAGLGSIDTLLTSVVADNITHTKHNSNQELIAQGIGNAVSGMFCGISGAGATMRTVVNVKSGGRTQLSGMVASLFLLAVLLGLGRFVKFVPLSVLAGILITVGWGIIDFKGLKDLFNIPKADAVVLITVLLLTVFVDLLIAVGIGMVIACVLFMKRASDLVEGSYQSGIITDFDKEMPWVDECGIPEDVRNHIYIQRLNGPIFFGSVTRFQEIMHDVPDNVKVVIIRMKLVSFIDQSGVYALETAIKDLHEKGIQVWMTIIQPQPILMLKNTKVIPEVIPEELTFKTFEDCVKHLRESLEVKSEK